MNRPQPKPKPAWRSSLEEQVSVSLWRAGEALSRRGQDLLKASDLSSAQYNILRILRGAGEKGLACGEIGERLISRDPDITRLLDRLDSRGLIARAREIEDRRVVKTRITEEGLRLLEALDAPVQELHRRQLGRMPRKELRQLLHLLERVRALVDGMEKSD